MPRSTNQSKSAIPLTLLQTEARIRFWTICFITFLDETSLFFYIWPKTGFFVSVSLKYPVVVTWNWFLNIGLWCAQEIFHLKVPWNLAIGCGQCSFFCLFMIERHHHHSTGKNKLWSVKVQVTHLSFFSNFVHYWWKLALIQVYFRLPSNLINKTAGEALKRAHFYCGPAQLTTIAC